MLEASHRDGFLSKMKMTIDGQKFKVMGDRASFTHWLDDLLRDFAAEARRRNAPTPAPTALALDGRGGR